ncbi:hypothetical protein DL766_003120 [Monosporascus sp. MC13-8B]|nr:hypothetical protein DL763_004024 [Monosporascus cannonballus]RYP34132.1 hypothetical protein DL766_003120 [Monosporascus sp. MC13-8B]
MYARQPTAYARYVPPPKTNNQSANSQHLVFNGENDADHHEDGPPAKKAKITQDGPPKKKVKKHKRTAKADADADVSAVINRDRLNSDEHAVGSQVSASPDGASNKRPFSLEAREVPQEAPSEPKKEKKPKKKKLKPAQEATLEDADGTLTRHKSVLEKAAKSIQKPPEPKATTSEEQDVSMQDAPEVNGGTEEPTELHGLEPLPQPEPVPVDTSRPTYETLPAWLAEPIRVSPQATASFTDLGLTPELGISPEVVERLSAKGYTQAFAIQTAVIPQLLPHHCKTMQGDILVSAATGSGKTLAYALPLIRDLSQGNRHLTRLRALVVLPTRELVRQAQRVFEECAGAFALDGAKRRVRIGIGMGSQTLQREQITLAEREEQYDPVAFSQRLKRLETVYEDEDDEVAYNTEDEEKKDIRRREDKIPTLPDHVITYKSKVDILICTPGRLVEHINYTPGFSLDYVRWLIVDEADKLLSQNFQQWLDVVIPRLHTNDVPGARNHKQSNLSGVRKVILSATMTRDLDRLGGLKLRGPKLVVLEGAGGREDLDTDKSRVEHTLPELLEEAALKVSDPNLKPLFLVDLLRSPFVLGNHVPTDTKTSQDDDADETSSSGSSSTSSSSGSDAASSSDSSSESDSDSDSSTARRRPSLPKNTPSVLIFTKSNETAVRLSRLLGLLSPSLGPLIGTLTSTTPYSTRKSTLRAFTGGKLRILVASDLVARGIDLPRLDHVVNYDMPVSVAAYVHRVGRTARAGRGGRAWTLFTDPEARWFWREVAGLGGDGGTMIRRARKVERIRVTEEKKDREAFEAKVRRYEDALERLGMEAAEASFVAGRTSFFNNHQAYDAFEITPRAPYLALLGDIGNVVRDREEYAGFSLEQLAKIEAVPPVPGNHEPYHSSWLVTRAALERFRNDVETRRREGEEGLSAFVGEAGRRVYSNQRGYYFAQARRFDAEKVVEV